MKLGGLGLNSAVRLAPSALLSSCHSSEELVDSILPPNHTPDSYPLLEEVLSLWSDGHDISPPEGAGAAKQSCWDNITSRVLAEKLLEEASDEVCRARLLAAGAKESGAWLHALPIDSVGLCMDDNSVKIAVGLRLGLCVRIAVGLQLGVPVCEDCGGLAAGSSCV